MARKELIQDLGNYKRLYRDPSTGTAWVEDGTSGTAASAHPNVDASAHPDHVKKLYGNDHTVRSHGFIFNVDQRVGHDELTNIAAANCQCGGSH